MDFTGARKNMVKNQVMPCDVTNKRLLQAMLDIPKENFVPPSSRSQAYNEASISTLFEREVIESRFLGKMINAFNPKPNEFILDIGSVLGYSTAILAKMSQAVAMLERKELLEGREALFTKMGLDNVIVSSSSLEKGLPEHAPYEGIFIQLAIDFFPDTLVEQLRLGGKVLAVFNKEGIKQCYLGIKTKDGLSWAYQFDANVAYLAELRFAETFEF